jgi:two-component system, NarL family, nitrate/nitrite response regulator NarL
MSSESLLCTTIAFVDDHPVLLSGASQIFASQEGFQVVARGKSANDIVHIATTLRPDILVTDLSMAMC